MVKKLIGILVFLIVATVSAHAQFTTVTGTVNDPNGVPYAACNGSVSFVPSPTATQQATLSGSLFQTSIPLNQCDPTGTFTITVADNNQVTDGHAPGQQTSQWKFDICAADRKTCFNSTITITGTTQNISATLKTAAALLPPSLSALAGGTINPLIVRAGDPAASFNSNSYLQSAFNIPTATSRNYFSCLNFSGSVCLRSIMEDDTAAQVGNVGISSVMFANHPSGTITSWNGAESDISNGNLGNITNMVGYQVGLHLRGSGSHGTVTNAIGVQVVPCDMPDAATSTFTNCYGFYTGPVVNGTNNYGFFQSPIATGTGLSGINVLSDQIQQQQGLPATAGANFGSPAFSQFANVWNGSASIVDTISFQNTPVSAGANPFMVWNVQHTGSTGGFIMQLPTASIFQFAADNTAQIGQVAGNRPAHVYTGTDVQTPKYLTTTNCAGVGSAANPSVAACGSASAGHFSCATNATGGTCQINTTAVTTNSEIFVFESDTTVTGTALGVTCNTSTTVNPATRLLASSVAATSFTINLGTVTTNPACFSYWIVN